MGDPTLMVVVILLAIAGIAGTVILLLMPARERILNDEPAVNDERVSSQWAGGLDSPGHQVPASHDNVIHHNFGGHGLDGGGHGG